MNKKFFISLDLTNKNHNDPLYPTIAPRIHTNKVIAFNENDKIIIQGTGKIAHLNIPPPKIDIIIRGNILKHIIFDSSLTAELTQL